MLCRNAQPRTMQCCCRRASCSFVDIGIRSLLSFSSAEVVLAFQLPEAEAVPSTTLRVRLPVGYKAGLSSCAVAVLTATQGPVR